MKYFLDSAKLDEIKYAYENYGIDGVTTNPRHIMNSGLSFYKVLEGLSNWIEEKNLNGYEKFPISVEIDPSLTDSKDMIEMAREVSDICENFVIKIPCNEQGLIASRKLEEEGIRTNVTLVFSPSQALNAARGKALFVSPFIGWKEQNGEDCKKYIEDIVNIYKNYEYYKNTQIICAAVRNPKQIVDCALAGADIVTAGLGVFKDSFEHSYTDSGLKKFIDAWNNTDTEKETLK